jgi:glycosyltransferase involved in cell wall biosynthesis
LLAQRTDLPIEVVVVDDGSEDGTAVIVERWQARFARLHMSLRVIRQQRNGGAARARNVGIEHAAHDWILTCDADDTSRFNRVEALRRAASIHSDAKNTLFGSKFVRDPPHATERYSKWANSLTPERLVLERFRECTLIQPTWVLRGNQPGS